MLARLSASVGPVAGAGASAPSPPAAAGASLIRFHLRDGRRFPALPVTYREEEPPTYSFLGGSLTAAALGDHATELGAQLLHGTVQMIGGLALLQGPHRALPPGIDQAALYAVQGEPHHWV